MKAAFVLLAGAATVMANAVHQQPGKRIHHGVADHLKGKRDETELEKRDSFSGTATWYDVTTAAGACGDWMSPSDFVVALNSPQLNAYGGYVNGKPASCYQSITITYNGMSQVATIKDECPTCDWGSLDLSAGLFGSFADLGQGVFPITWWFNDGSGGGSGDTGSSSNNNNNNNYTPDPTTSSTPAWTPDPTPTSTTPTSTYVPPPETSTSSVYTPPPSSSSSDTSSSTTTTPSNNINMMNHAVVQFAGMINVAAHN